MSGRSAGAAQSIHANALIVSEAGVLIRGPAGAGKSGLTLALMALARQRGLFVALVGDDRVTIRVKGGRVLANGAPSIRGLIERRGHGVVRAKSESCAVIRLVVDLLPAGERAARLPEAEALRAAFGDIHLPRMAFDAGFATVERAHAVLGRLDKTGDEIISAIAHFA